MMPRSSRQGYQGQIHVPSIGQAWLVCPLTLTLSMAVYKWTNNIVHCVHIPHHTQHIQRTQVIEFTRQIRPRYTAYSNMA